MDDTAVPKRLATLLQARLRATGVLVAELVVLPALDGITVQWVLDDGSFYHATLNNPRWYTDFSSNEAEFVESIAATFPRRLPDSLWDSKGQLDLQYLFVRVVVDLDRCSRSLDDYDNLRVPALLRTLVFDKAPLLHKVRRIHRAPVVFRVGRVLINDVVDPKTLPPPTKPRLVKVKDGRTFDAVADAFDPANHRGHIRELTLEDLLKALVVKIEDHWVSVKELLEHLAYVDGVVHHGIPKDSKRPADTELHRWRRMVQASGRGPLHATAAAIGRVVVAGLTPLAFECDRAIAEGKREFTD